MSALVRTRCHLLEMAVEGIAPLIPGCGEEWSGEDLTRRFGPRITQGWLGWLRFQPPHEAMQAVLQLATLTPEDARLEAAAALDHLGVDARSADRAAALDYLARIPASVQHALGFDPATGTLTRPLPLPLEHAEALLPLLPRRPARPAPREELQAQPSSPQPPLPALEVRELPPGTKEASEARFRHSSVVTKLRILRRCHAVARRDRHLLFLRRLMVLVLALFVGGGLGTMAGIGVYQGAHDYPYRHVQRYRDQFGRMTHYVRGQEVSQQQYDYYLATHDNEASATAGAIAVGLLVLAVVVALFLVFLGRRRTGTPDNVKDQIAAIVKEHPEAVSAWGGPSVLYEPELVEEVLRIEESGRR